MDYLILVGRFDPLPSGFTEQLQLYEVRGKLMERQAAKALEKMLAAAEREGMGLQVISGYRSFEYQKMLWEKELNLAMDSGLSYSQAEKKISRTLAKPGTSEHSTGLAVDLACEGEFECDPALLTKPQGKWLCKNAAEYGFILRYPRLKEHITGIDYEPWHYRYVGREAAMLIKESGICLEEFLHFYSDRYTLE